MARQQKSGKSPYRRHNKAPYVYSAEYQSWRAALERRDDKEVQRAAAAHSKKFGCVHRFRGDD